eukprot:m.498248 g.498248  ORF g.498248 m.498248 type:complete len:63 (-) comp157616_c0_seq1:103-291(-)
MFCKFMVTKSVFDPIFAAAAAASAPAWPPPTTITSYSSPNISSIVPRGTALFFLLLYCAFRQ